MLIECRLDIKYFISIIPSIIIATQLNRYFYAHLADEKNSSEILSNCWDYAANYQGR